MNWLTEAKKHIGQKEIPGAQSNPWILSLWMLKDKWLGNDDSKVPWCGAFMNYVFKQCNMPTVKAYYRAKEWLNWGQPIPKPKRGCVVVFERQGGGHVGFVLGQNKKGDLLVLGGNQNDSVNVAAFNINRVVGYRWPSGHPLPSNYYLPVLDIKAALSTNEA